MEKTPLLLPIIWDLFLKLRRRGFTIGLEDCEALQDSLKAGFGWNSRSEFMNLCSSLWAKSNSEQKILMALFDQIVPNGSQWIYSLPQEEKISSVIDLKSLPSAGQNLAIVEDIPRQEFQQVNNDINEPDFKTESQSGLPPISIRDVQIAKNPFVFVSQFPLSYREVAQTWRRLKRPTRVGAATELDIEATITRRSQLGVSTNLVLQPRRTNIAKLLLLVDRQGSMAPFHKFCDEVCKAIQEAGCLGETKIYYFHNVPAEGADDQVLAALASSNSLFPTLDSILSQIKPLMSGHVYTDHNLLFPKLLQEVLESQTADSAVVVLSDGGAARGDYRVTRLLDTIAFMKALGTYNLEYVWLNPLAANYWQNSTAAQISRHIPMFSLDREGMEKAVNVLRGHQYVNTVEKSI
jgi:uncharacterized protein